MNNREWQCVLVCVFSLTRPLLFSNSRREPRRKKAGPLLPHAIAWSVVEFEVVDVEVETMVGRRVRVRVLAWCQVVLNSI